MKQAIHPKYYETQYECACGNKFLINSTQKDVVHVDICSKCHPMFTGKEKLVDSEGQVEKFRKKYEQIKAQPVKSAVKLVSKNDSQSKSSVKNEEVAKKPTLKSKSQMNN